MLRYLILAIVLSLLAMVAINWEKHVAYEKGYEAGYKDCKLEFLERGNAQYEPNKEDTSGTTGGSLESDGGASGGGRQNGDDLGGSPYRGTGSN